MKRANNSGFTLIELSIVIVIIGLIVGGVLTGRDLIRAAEIRSSVSQIEKIDAAVNTFKIKYNAIPGDILAVNASAFGFTLRSGATGHGDGNGLLKGCDVSGVANDIKFGCEVSLFWHDLSDAGIITGHFIGTDQCCDNNGALTSTHTMDNFLPASKLGSGVYINAWGLSGNTVGRTKTLKHYYQFLKSFSAIGDYTGVYITPSDAQNIDTKMDDGFPLTGKVFSQWFNNIDYCDGTCTQLQSVSTKACASNITNSPTSTYNVATIIVPACIIEINTSW